MTSQKIETGGRGPPEAEPSRDDEALLEAIALMAREEQERGPDDATLEALASLSAGTLDGPTHARVVGEVSTATLALYEPLGGDFQARALETALAGLGVESEARLAPPLVMPRSEPPRRRWILAALPLAVAAGVAFWVMAPAPGLRLSEYTLQLDGGEATTRAASPAGAVPTIGPGSRLALVMRPAKDGAAPVAARAWLVRDGALQPWAVTPEVSSTGSVRVAGTWETLGLSQLAAGEWEALVIVSTPDHQPDASEISAALSGTPPADAQWRLQRGRFIVHHARASD